MGVDILRPLEDNEVGPLAESESPHRSYNRRVTDLRPTRRCVEPTELGRAAILVSNSKLYSQYSATNLYSTRSAINLRQMSSELPELHIREVLPTTFLIGRDSAINTFKKRPVGQKTAQAHQLGEECSELLMGSLDGCSLC